MFCRSRSALLRAGYAGLLLGPAGAAWATSVEWVEGDAPPAIVRVEEDWMMVLNEPDDEVDSPQFHTIMSPYQHLDGNYAQVLWNYRETPDYVSGGVQLQSYDGDYNIRMRSVEYRQLSTVAETVTWTQALTTDGLVISFEVFNGLSETWGTFGRDMRIDENVDLPELNQYSPEMSVENSCVTYGSNRVDLLLITEVRYYSIDGLVGVDSTPRVVFEFDDSE